MNGMCGRELRLREGENVRARAHLFSSLSAGVIVKGLCWPGGLPSAIFIVGNVGAVMSNWEPRDECIWGI